ncbi:oxidoreductase [Apiospora phragmitis]|uniref:Oxidoreductase n=1 Tax=Apiospora phragmitis TaxID=2905665 RepID=A0ABR1VG13_9PEZI
MAPVEILIIGCGIAGPTLATFLCLIDDMPAAQRPRITIVERASEHVTHARGQNIDVRGVGVAVLRRLGIEGLVRRSTTGEAGVRLVDERNRVWAASAADRTGLSQTPTADIEILRGRLSEICWRNSLRASAEVEREREQGGGGTGRGIEYIFGDYVEELDQGDGDKVHVRLAKSGLRRSFDLVVGADGLHSRTRKLVWGAEGEGDRVKRLGMYAGFFSIPREGETDDAWRRWFHTPGRRSVMLRPDGTGRRTTVLMSVVKDDDSADDENQKLAELAARGHAGVAVQKALLEEHFRDAGWECERILRGMGATDDFYFDMVAQVKMDRWSKGRVVLLGDAGYCASPISGLGTTLAFTAAYNLAGCLQEYIKGTTPDPSSALVAYEAKMRPVVEEAQRLAPGQAYLMHPETAWGIRMSHLFASFVLYIKSISTFLGKLFPFGPQMADEVPLEEYGFKVMPGWELEDKSLKQ